MDGHTPAARIKSRADIPILGPQSGVSRHHWKVDRKVGRL